MAEQRALAVLHVHSNWSHDGRDPLPALAAFAAREQLRWVFLTDHAEDFDEARFREYVTACRAHSTPTRELVPGLEFRFDTYPGLHLLAVGLRQWIAPRTPAEFCREAGVHAEFLVMAHPLLTKYLAPEEVLGEVHAVEVWNAGYNTRYLPDGLAVAFWKAARKRWPHLVATAGTDQHDLRTEGGVRLSLPHTEEPFPTLRAGGFRNHGLTVSFGAVPAWGPIRLGVLSGLRRVLDYLRRWRAKRERQAPVPTKSR